MVDSVAYILLYKVHCWNEWVDLGQPPCKDCRYIIQMVFAHG